MENPRSLLPLPTELLVLIASDLNAEDYGALRLSCKSLADRLFPYFAEKFFTTKHFFRNYYSLSVLRDISESRLSPYVKSVILGTELLPSDLWRWSNRNSVTVDDCLKVFADQRSLCASGWDRDLLFLSFSKLPNLESVSVLEYEGDCFEDELDTPRTNETTKAGYGLKGLMAEFGIRDMSAFRQDEFDEEEVGISCVQAVLAAAARTRRPLKTFKIIYHSGGQRAIACDALHIPFFQKKEIPPILATIEELHLDVFQKRLTPWPLVTGAGQVFDTVECDTFPLRVFLGHTSQLRRLTLGQLNHQESKDGFWDWLAANPNAKYKGPGDAARLTTPPPVALNHLQELRLKGVRVPLAPMSALIRKISSTLRILSFHQAMLFNISADKDHNGLPRNLWEELFRIVLEVCELDEIEVETCFSKRLNDGSHQEDGEDSPPRNGNLMVYQRDIHYEGEDLVPELSEDMMDSMGRKERHRSPFDGEVDPNDPYAYPELYDDDPEAQFAAEFFGPHGIGVLGVHMPHPYDDEDDDDEDDL